MAERIKMAVGVLVVVAGLYGFYAMKENYPLVARLGVLLGAFALATAVMWFTQAGKDFIVFARESVDEAKRVVWPTRKETLQTTGVVFVFVFVMAVFLWVVDAGLLWVTQKLLGQGG